MLWQPFFYSSELKEIDLSNNLIQATGAKMIINALIGHPNLNKMNICKNAITDEAANTKENSYHKALN